MSLLRLESRQDSTNRPRILLAVSSLGPGGAERVASALVNHLAAEEWPAALLTLPRSTPDHYALDPRVERTSLDLLWESHSAWHTLVSIVRRSLMIRGSVKAYVPDVVLSFVDQTNVQVLGALVGSRVPVILSERVDPRDYRLDRAWERVRRALYPLAAGVVVQTESVAEWAASLVPSSRVRVIPNFVRNLPEPPPFGGREKLIIGVGRLAWQKGFDLLISAFAGSSACVNGWRLIVLGEGPERCRLEAMTSELGLAERVSLPGVVAEPSEWLARARVFALPARFEAFPNALLEAMAMGCAVVAADCPSGPGEIIRNGHDGLLVPVEDTVALTSALDKLTEQPGQAERLAQAAVEVRERFAPERILPQWADLIGTVVERRAGSR